ncbi:MAG: hypothetical protein CSA26_04250 [Desulfobacterales bacterium]|nr:MAG: hypothetical protein CSA26_04250 [Desulfobacterales bacterium]
MVNDDIVIQPVKGRHDSILPPQAVIIPNPADAKEAGRRLRQRGLSRRSFYYTDLFVDHKRGISVAGPCLGAPAAALVMEKLIVLGVKDIIVLSCCGAINAAFSLGDIVLAVSGVSGEGVSRYYCGNRTVLPSRSGTRRLRDRLRNGERRLREGCIWSTDAPYRESRKMLGRLREQDGVDGVDMEFTALCSVASFRGVSCSGIFIVSDELWRDCWRPGFTSESFRESRDLVFDCLLFAHVKKAV